MDVEYLISVVTSDFSDRYSNFNEFSTSKKYKPFWDLCIETIRCEDFVKNIRFCNDYYNIPPVRVFIDINRKQIDEIAQSDFNKELFDECDNQLRMKNYLKQSLGAFWGMVFKFGLGYNERKTVTMIKDRYYGIATASRFEYTKISN